jgi:GAF domain-containing protein
VGAPASSGALEELVREHAALRRVATLVAREPLPAEVFAAVTREAGTLLGAQRATLLRVASPQWAVVVASWSDGTAPPVPVGHRGALDGRGILVGCCAPHGRSGSRTSTRSAGKSRR